MSLRVSTLFFDMNSYYASVAQAEEPALMGRPVGVLTTDARNAACIAASVEAKRCGVRMGTRQDEARLLCPGIVFRPVKHDVCVDYHHAILQAVETVVPVHRVWSIDECSCLLMGSEQELPRALEIGRALQRAVLRISPALRCSVGLAPTRLLAKLAAELEKPMGLHWLTPEVLPEKIAHLALDDLPGVSWRMKARLEAAGISDVNMLYGIAPKRARAIWGSVAGERFIRELRGEMVVWPETKRGMIGHGQVLTGPNATPEGARLVARRLLVKAAARLRREGYFTRSLSISLKAQDKRRQYRERSLYATQDTFFLLEALSELWAGLTPCPRPKAVSVTLGGLIKEARVMDDLFAPKADRAPLCLAIDRLNQRFGQDTVRYGLLPPHHVPYTGAKIAFGRIPLREDFAE
ncbi:Y-family DNA polymerase [Celeribacter sp. ULVN23_4]